ncbi:hypothetical protein ACLIIZ_04775 [Azonexus caeni]|uniref:hypothetical protein n=1 Tax=Azonexus caeni TaxID=266126 RepID=UPI002C7E03AB|nr:hypothetical protein [Azonexus sp.]
MEWAVGYGIREFLADYDIGLGAFFKRVFFCGRAAWGNDAKDKFDVFVVLKEY